MNLKNCLKELLSFLIKNCRITIYYKILKYCFSYRIQSYDNLIEATI